MRATNDEATETRWLDSEAVAKILRVRASQLLGMVGRGRIPRPSYHLGYGSPRWDRETLEVSMRRAAAVKRGAGGRKRLEPMREEEPVSG